MQEFLESIQHSAFGLWVAGGDTIFAYPTILALQTVGLGIVVGMSAIIDCRVLGRAAVCRSSICRGCFASCGGVSP